MEILAYWLETNQLGDLLEHETWIIDLDEDVILTDSFMIDLCENFLQTTNKPKIGLPQAMIKLNRNSGILNTISQIFRFTVDLTQHWSAMKLFNATPAVCHGGCYVSRADCSMDKNAECGRYCSISDDNAYILSMISKGIKLEFMNGWFIEDAPISFYASILQRARWQRGHAYLLRYSTVHWTRKIALAVWVFVANILVPLCAMRIVLVFVLVTGNANHFLPAAMQRPYGGDTLTAFVLATYIYALFYACWFMLPPNTALVYSLISLTGIPTLLLHVMDIMCVGVVIRDMIMEFKIGHTTWGVTEKVDRRKT